MVSLEPKQRMLAHQEEQDRFVRYREHISKARAAASVHGPSILENVVEAACARSREARVEHLQEAYTDCKEILEELERALAAEIGNTTQERVS